MAFLWFNITVRTKGTWVEKAIEMPEKEFFLLLMRKKIEKWRWKHEMSFNTKRKPFYFLEIKLNKISGIDSLQMLLNWNWELEWWYYSLSHWVDLIHFNFNQQKNGRRSSLRQNHHWECETRRWHDKEEENRSIFMIHYLVAEALVTVEDKHLIE